MEVVELRLATVVGEDDRRVNAVLNDDVGAVNNTRLSDHLARLVRSNREGREKGPSSLELIKVDEPIVVVVAAFYKATCLVRSVPGESDEGPDFCRIFQLKS